MCKALGCELEIQMKQQDVEATLKQESTATTAKTINQANITIYPPHIDNSKATKESLFKRTKLHERNASRN